MHISSLPTELLMVIIKWVVSKDLDIRSIGYFSQVRINFQIILQKEALQRQGVVKILQLRLILLL